MTDGQEVTLTLEQMKELGIGDANRDPVTGRFTGKAYSESHRPKQKGDRNKLTQQFLDRVAARQESGLAMDEILMDIAQDPASGPELRFKAAAKVADLVYPRASSVEVKVDEAPVPTKEQIDQRLRELLAATL